MKEICQRPGCGRDVPATRRRYCSEECAREGNKRSASERLRRRYDRMDRAIVGLYARMRVCLACDKPFLSEGPWNRICRRCSDKHVHMNIRVRMARVGVILPPEPEAETLSF